MTDNVSLEQVKHALADRNLKAVAEATGLSPHTLYRIAKGVTTPHNATVSVLAGYLFNQQHQKSAS